MADRNMRAAPVDRVTRLLLAALVGFGPVYSAAESVTVVSWGGSYADACEEAYLKPFAAETGIEVLLDDYNGGLSQVRSQVEAGRVYWDIVDIQFPDLVRGLRRRTLRDPGHLAAGARGGWFGTGRRLLSRPDQRVRHCHAVLLHRRRLQP